jgi:hypothetical protein
MASRDDAMVWGILSTAVRAWWHSHSCAGCDRDSLHALPLATAAVESRAYPWSCSAA